VEKEMKCYVIDACALIAYFRGEEGGEKLKEILKDSDNKCYMHAVNLGEVYYDSVRYSDKEYAQQLLKDVNRNQEGPGLSGKLQITNKGVSFGQILNASGEGHKVAFF
jgi:predicted nucleic acid-binding protein